MATPIPLLSSKSSAIDFQGVLRKLREYCGASSPMWARDAVEGAVAWSAINAYTIMSREAAAQSVSYLYEHLTQHEQFREAAALLAFAMPHDIRGDPRIVELQRHALETARHMTDPESELAAFYIGKTVEMPDDRVLKTDLLPSRARYYISTVMLREANVAIEYGCVPAGNTICAAKAIPDVTWVGIDASAAQIESCIAQAKRLGVSAHFDSDPSNAWFGKADVVGLLDCIEHTVYPDTLLDKAEAYLNGNGVMVLTVPNGAWSISTDNVANVGPGQHVAVGHPNTLAAYLQSRGAKILGIEVLPGPLSERNSSVCATYRPPPPTTIGGTRGDTVR